MVTLRAGTQRTDISELRRRRRGKVSKEQSFADLIQELHIAKKTGALYVSIVETSEDLVRMYFRNGIIYHIRYGSAIGKDCLDILEFYNLWGATDFEGIESPGGAVSRLPDMKEIISKIRVLNKKVRVT
jgi:hypothetical protein